MNTADKPPRKKTIEFNEIMSIMFGVFNQKIELTPKKNKNVKKY